MYNCFKLGFYSRLGIPDNQEVPNLEPLIKAAYENTGLGEAMEQKRLVDPISSDPNIQRSVTERMIAENPDLSKNRNLVPSNRNLLIGTPFGEKIPDYAQQLQTGGAIAGLANLVSPKNSGIGLTLSHPAAQFAITSGILAPQAYKASRMVGSELGFDPNGNAQAVMNAAAPSVAGAATTRAGQWLGTLAQKALQSPVVEKAISRIPKVGPLFAATLPTVASWANHGTQLGTVMTPMMADNLATQIPDVPSRVPDSGDEAGLKDYTDRWNKNWFDHFSGSKLGEQQTAAFLGQFDNVLKSNKQDQIDKYVSSFWNVPSAGPFYRYIASPKFKPEYAQRLLQGAPEHIRTSLSK